MSNIKLIADSGSTKTEWCLLKEGKPKIFYTQGLSPYFLDEQQITEVLKKEVRIASEGEPAEIFFYGTGCKADANKNILGNAIRAVFTNAVVDVKDDLTGAARSLCGSDRGVACILGTGSNSCYYNGKIIEQNSPGLGYILGDEGSGAFLGKSLIQHYLYGLMDDELNARFDAKFITTPQEILENVYRKPLANRYLASFALFLAENRGHYMVENIIGDGLNAFFYTHLVRYPESAIYPVHFTGGIAYAFQDILMALCSDYGFTIGNIFKTPMEGLVKYHNKVM